MTAGSLKVMSCCTPGTRRVTTLRAARDTDLARAHELLQNAALPIDGVADHFSHGYAVAEQNGEIVGVAGLELYAADGLLRSVVVDVAWRGTGVGELLVQDRLRFAREQKLRHVYLLTTTAPDFFTRFGFEQVARNDAPPAMQTAPEFAFLCADSAIVMRLDVAAGADVRAYVRDRYADAARAAARGDQGSCCGDSKARPWNPITSSLYEQGETAGLPAEALLASLGCGNPTALAQLESGETVLDLGSGGGIDVLLSAKRVGPTGKAYGLDMTDDMLALARANQAKAGVSNVEFLKGEIEDIPLPDNAVDVIISNCVINLSADKARVLREAFRVLKPGGRFAVSDIVVRGTLPEEIRRNAELWTGCVAGALADTEYERLLRAAGFADVDIEPTRIYGPGDVAALAGDAGLALEASQVSELDARIMSAFVRATKPA